jgi:integrase/recombinase XerD
LFDRDGKRKYLNQSERKAYFQAASSEGDLAERTFCLTLFYTGCRISEGLNLTPQRVDLRGKTVVFETMKRRARGFFRSVPIPESLAKMLGEIIVPANPSVPVWTYSRTTAFRLVKEGMKRAGVTGAMACPKGLRHGFAVACIAQDIPLTTVQKWLGHARLETTAIYLNATGDEERAFAKRLWAEG